jgi:serine protease Do
VEANNQEPVIEKTRVRQDSKNKAVAVIVSIFTVIAIAFSSGLAGSWVYGEFFGNNANLDHIRQNQQDDGNIVTTAEEQSIASVAETVGKSVVSIVAKTQSRFGSQTGAGTGIIVSKDGYIMTNKHVVSGASDVSVILSDGTAYDDVVIMGEDPLNDVAFIKVSGVDSLPAAKLGDSSTVRIGQQVIAIGNALGKYQNTVTTGIISGLGRPVVASSGSGEYESLTDLLQTDAAINSGNSGGPLVNLAGQVIGMNTAVAVDANSIGFAIPINSTKGILRGLLETGKVERVFLGVNFVAITPSVAKEYELSVQSGAYVYSNNSSNTVMIDSPADKAGLKRGDIITKVDSHDITATANLASVLGLYRPGEVVSIEYIRDGKSSKVSVELSVYTE